MFSALVSNLAYSKQEVERNAFMLGMAEFTSAREEGTRFLPTNAGIFSAQAPFLPAPSTHLFVCLFGLSVFAVTSPLLPLVSQM